MIELKMESMYAIVDEFININVTCNSIVSINVEKLQGFDVIFALIGHIIKETLIVIF